MIRVNLAKRKRSAISSDSSPKSRLSGLSLNVDLGELRPVLVSIGLSLGAMYVIQYLADSYKEDELAKVQSQIDQMNTEGRRLQTELTKLESFRSLKVEIERTEQLFLTKINTIEALLKGRKESPFLLKALSESIPQEVWLTDFKLQGAQFALNGRATTIDDVGNFIRQLSDSAFFTDVQLTGQVVDQNLNGVGVVKAFQMEGARVANVR